ncbi:hypothetical protein N9558_02880 [Porticoccaceae bacterium]|nr:hypothetical protein [Porticoccaceae bacterium]
MLRIVFIFFIVFIVPKEVLAKEITTPSGVYSGSFRNNRFHGEGMMEFFNGDVYEGMWRYGTPHGFGRFTRSQGGYSEGVWKKSQLHGPSVKVTPSGKRIEGDWSNGKQHGPADVLLPNGDHYEGIWDHGTRIGGVSYVFANGDEYHGPLENDMPSGSGNLAKSDGDQYVGSMLNGKLDGYGEYKDFQSKTEFKGIFKDGEKHGPGVMLWPDDSRWKGIWDSDKAAGVGTHTDSKGETYSGLYGELKPGVIGLTENMTAKEVTSKSPPSKSVTLSCSEYAFDLVIIKDSAWNELKFSKKSGTSYCLE